MFLPYAFMYYFKFNISTTDICWEIQSHACTLLTPTRPHKDGSWTWNAFLPRARILSGLALCVEYLSCFRLNSCSFVQLTGKFVYHMTLGLPYCYICALQRRDGILYSVAQRGRGNCLASTMLINT